MGGRADAGAPAGAVNGDGGIGGDSAPPEETGGAGASTCAAPVAGTLVLPSSLVSGKLDGPTQPATTSCGTEGARGPQAAYLLNVSEQTAVTLTVKAADRFVIAIYGMCDDPSSELACKNGEPDPSGASLRAVLDPGTYWIVVHLVDASASGADYTLNLASNGACENAADIVENASGFGNAATVFGDLAGGEPRALPLACADTGDLGNLLNYRASLPAGGTLVATARRSDLGEPLPVSLAEGCASTQCLAGAMGQARYSNTGTMPTDVIIQVGSGAVVGSLPFELQVATLELAANAVCTAPNAITADTPVDGDTSFGSTSSLPCTDDSAGALYYSMVVPAGALLSAEVKPVDPSDAQLVILDTCSADSCLASSQGQPGQVVAEFENLATSPRLVILAVSAVTRVGPFTLTAMLQ